MGKAHVYASLTKIYLTWLVYLLLSFTCILIRRLVWWISGTLEKIRISERPENYGASAHKMTIICQHRLDEFVESRLSDYILMHHSFVAPEFVLRDDVHLMQVTDKDAIFVQIKKNCRGPEEYAFSIQGYTLDAKHVITMPLRSFNRLASEMEKTDAKVVFLQNQTRCGGTLFTELFKASERCITYCEPHPINGACKLYYMQNKLDRNDMIEMLRNIVRLLCKPRRNVHHRTLAYVIKPTATSMISANLIQEAIPEVEQFFIYRDPMKVGISMRRTGEALASLRLLYHLPNIPRMCAPLMKLLGYCEVDFRGWTPKVSQEIEWGYRLAAVAIKHYLHYRDQGIRIHGIRFENLRDYGEDMSEKIFDICGLPKSLVPKALNAFGRDSQEETPISMECLKKLIPVPPKPTPAVLDAVQEMCRELAVAGPAVWQDDGYMLPGSLKP